MWSSNVVKACGITNASGQPLVVANTKILLELQQCCRGALTTGMGTLTLCTSQPFHLQDYDCVTH